MNKLYSLEGEYIKDIFVRTPNLTGVIVTAENEKFWYKNGKYHRLNGPAIECNNGYCRYIIHGKECTKEQHKLLVDLMTLKNIL